MDIISVIHRAGIKSFLFVSILFVTFAVAACSSSFEVSFYNSTREEITIRILYDQKEDLHVLNGKEESKAVVLPRYIKMFKVSHKNSDHCYELHKIPVKFRRQGMFHGEMYFHFTEDDSITVFQVPKDYGPGNKGKEMIGDDFSLFPVPCVNQKS